jgi:predicted small secreted protein
MKIAYIILAHNNFKHLENLINAIDDENVRIYIHIDKKTSIDFKHTSPHVYFLPEEKRVKVYWGGISIIKATINTLTYAKENKTFEPDYYILISGVDYPIRSKEFLNTLLKKKLVHKSTDRLEYFYFEFDRRNKNLTFYTLKTIEYLLRKFRIKRTKQLKFKPYAGSQWFALTNSCIDYILHQYDTDKEMVKFFHNSIVPDESLFHTIIGNSPFKSKVAGNLTFVEFLPNQSSPRLISRNDVEVFKKQVVFESIYVAQYTPCFARKFDDNSQEIINLIDSELRNVKM